MHTYVVHVHVWDRLDMGGDRGNDWGTGFLYRILHMRGEKMWVPNKVIARYDIYLTPYTRSIPMKKTRSRAMGWRDFLLRPQYQQRTMPRSEK